MKHGQRYSLRVIVLPGQETGFLLGGARAIAAAGPDELEEALREAADDNSVGLVAVAAELRPWARGRSLRRFGPKERAILYWLPEGALMRPAPGAEARRFARPLGLRVEIRR